MTFDEAYSECVTGARMRHDGMQPGCYIEHLFSRGVVKCWPVDRVEDEPTRSQCDFIPNDSDKAANWYELTRPKLDSWGKPIGHEFFHALNAEREMPHVEVKPQRSKWGQVSTEAATIAIQQKAAKNDLGFTLDPAKQVPLRDAPPRDKWGRAS